MTLENPPYWVSLVNAWCRKGGTNGLSIPYIIGARTVVDKAYVPLNKDIDDFISEITNSEYEGFEVYIVHCNELNTPVIGIRSHRNQPKKRGLKSKIEINLHNPKYKGLSAIEILGSVVDGEIRTAILAGNYSRSKFLKIWREYTGEDRASIKKALLC